VHKARQPTFAQKIRDFLGWDAASWLPGLCCWKKHGMKSNKLFVFLVFLNLRVFF
jgi:hypothetical protein